MQTKQVLQITFEQEMADASLRITHVRQKMFDLLCTTDRPLTIQEIVANIDGSHFVSVYRSVDALLKAGILKQVPRGFKYLFELSDKFHSHHHHATCESCGSSVEIHDESLEGLMNSLTLKSGLKPTKHHFELFGLCKNCRD